MKELDFRLDGRCALITGAGRGIGLGIARGLAAQGGAVVIQDIDLEVAEAEAKSMREAGGLAFAIGGDVSDLSQAATMIESAKKLTGGLHILVNNAAIQLSKNWRENTLEETQTMFNADLVFPLLICQEAAKIFREQRWGRIINIGSIQQISANPNMLPYSTSKAALAHMTKAMARDLGRDQITVNCIAPGWFDTWRNRHDFANEQEKIEKGRHIPWGRLGQPDDCAGLAVLLCSQAGEYITGQSIHVDGGMSAR